MDRSLRVLELLASDSRELTIAAIATSLDRSRPAVHWTLCTLTDRRMAVEREGTAVDASVGIVSIGELDVDRCAARVVEAAREIARAL